MKLTVIKFVQIGKYRFYNVPTYLYDDESNVTAYPAGGGLIGNDLLRRFNFTINYPAGEIHLSPNSHFSDPFDYSYTGLGIYYEAGTIYIEDIMPGSPGEKAGVKQGDILIGVNNNFSNNIMQYKSILQTEKEKIKLVVKRNKELKSLTIKPGLIY
jgi:predicted metalloprotease with PDZ domain